MIMASIRMRPGEGKIDSVLRTILRIWEPMRVEPGCLDFHCSRDINFGVRIHGRLPAISSRDRVTAAVALSLYPSAPIESANC